MNRLRCNDANASADSLDAEWKKHIEELREQLRSYDKVSLADDYLKGKGLDNLPSLRYDLSYIIVSKREV